MLKFVLFAWNVQTANILVVGHFFTQYGIIPFFLWSRVQDEEKCFQMSRVVVMYGIRLIAIWLTS